MSTDGSVTSAVRLRSNCLCCAAGCGIIAEVEGDRLISVRGDTEHPVSRGYLRPKGTNLPWTHHRPDRLTYPTIGGRRRPGSPREPCRPLRLRGMPHRGLVFDVRAEHVRAPSR